MNKAVSTRFELLRIEGKIDYYIELYSKAYRASRMKAAKSSKPYNLWKMTAEVLEMVLVRLKMIRKEVEKARYSPIPYQLSEAMKTIGETRFLLSSKTCYPNIKRSLETMLSDLELSLRKVYSQ